MNFPFSLPDNKQFDAVGFGLNAVDHLIVVPEYPTFDTKVQLLEHKQTAGGQAASTMVALQRLGLKTAYAGRFGSDTEGQFSLQALEAEGIDLEFAEVVEGAHNQLAFVFIDARNGERTIIWDRDERLGYGADEAPVALADQGRVLHLDGHDPLPGVRMARAARLDGHDPLPGARMARAARKEATIVSADIDNIYDGLSELLPLVDVLVGSREFPGRLTGIADEKTSLIELRARYGCAVVGMTLGDRGAMLYCEGQFIEAPAYDVPGGCLDTTGAGDAFHGGLLYGMLTGQDVETSLKLANATGALKCRELGARTSLPRVNELTEFLQTGKWLVCATPEIMPTSIAEAILQGAHTLRKAGVPEARREAGSLLAHVIGRDRTFILSHADDAITTEQLAEFHSALESRAGGMPLQYIVGSQEFFGLDFEVTRDVLIPRPETELLVETALALISKQEAAPLICDVGTGSGCIAITLLLELQKLRHRPDARAVAIDISEGALAVAQRNAARHAVTESMSFVVSDCFAAWGQGDQPNPGGIGPELFDLIVSNPPYVASGAIPSLQIEVRDFEPRLALEAGADGLSVIRRLLVEARDFLRTGGHFVFEIGFDQRNAVEQLIDSNIWKLLDIYPDLQEIPRVVALEKLGSA